MMYADVVILIGESMEEVMEAYEEWKKALEDKGLKINIGNACVKGSKSEGLREMALGVSKECRSEFH